PAPNILPREAADKEEAKRLSSIVPVVLDMNGFEKVYSDAWYYKLKAGTGVYMAYWDKTKLNGIGDIAIAKADLLNLFWEPGISDIQRSRHFFHVELEDNDLLIESYPQLEGKLGSKAVDVAQYVYDDTVDTSQKSAVIDWYYKKNEGGKTILHYVKFVGDEVLFATENDREPKLDELGQLVSLPMAVTGLYDHGMYPFVFDVLYPIEGTPAGFGYIDIGKDCQSYIDRGGQAILKNMLANARPRYFSRSEGGINEEEFADLDNDIVHVEGGVGEEFISPIKANPLSNIFLSVMQYKVDELKETTGNRDVSNGGTASGVTAASAIAAMQEAGSKLSRDNNKASFRAYRELIVMVIELIRQFYDLPRQFRIIGQAGAQEFITYTNAGLTPQSQGGNEFGVGMGERVPYFDIEVTAQKASPYSKMAQNELALQFYSAGFFNPQMASQALACLEMMDFDRKDFVMQKVTQNQMMFMMMQQQMTAAQQGSPESGKATAENVEETERLGGKEGKQEAANTKKSRQRVAESTSPR
ncbi:MAG: hypothetical protein IKC63_03860, partial [Clostridia bacterium]|nr:hypothetical protein [Clostridia bacterium]